MRQDKVAVLGIGNLLLTDDGCGIHAIRQMRGMDGFEGVNFIDGGTYIFDLLDVFTDYQRVIVIDSVKGGHRPGTVYRLAPGDLGALIREKSSLHEVQLLDLLKWVTHLGHRPNVMILGVEPAELGFSMELSPTVRAVLPQVIQEVKNLLHDPRFNRDCIS